MREDPSPVLGFQRQPTLTDWPGRLAAVFFVSGCNLRCRFCHNAALMGAPQPGLPWSRLEEVCRAFRENWVTGVVITGGEPTLVDDLGDLISFFRGLGFAVKVDTNGTIPAVVQKLAEWADCVAMDVKASPALYPDLTGWDDVAAIGRSIALVRGMEGRGIFRTTVLVPEHTDEVMHAVGEWIRGASHYRLQPFVPRPDLPDPAYRTRPRTPARRMEEIRALMRSYVREVVIEGV